MQAPGAIPSGTALPSRADSLVCVRPTTGNHEMTDCPHYENIGWHTIGIGGKRSVQKKILVIFT